MPWRRKMMRIACRRSMTKTVPRGVTGRALHSWCESKEMARQWQLVVSVRRKARSL